MSYFEDVYLKRMNLHGKTQQERVQYRKEKEFDELFLRKTQWQANIYQINDEESDIICSLQPNKWNESELISNILISTKNSPLKTGMILYIYQRIKGIEYNKIWLILHCEEKIAKGYYAYKAVCLDSVVNITNEYGDTLYSIPVKFVSSTNSIVSDYFSFVDAGYREPNSNPRFITQDKNFLKKDIYFDYNERGFQIAGKDNISIKNVAYVTIDERLTREVEPRTSEKIEVGFDKNFFLNNK